MFTYIIREWNKNNYRASGSGSAVKFWRLSCCILDGTTVRWLFKMLWCYNNGDEVVKGTQMLQNHKYLLTGLKLSRRYKCIWWRDHSTTSYGFKYFHLIFVTAEFVWIMLNLFPPPHTHTHTHTHNTCWGLSYPKMF